MNELQILVAVILISLSSARVTRLLAEDSITQRLRDPFLIYVGNGEYEVKDNFFGKLIHCTWCLGIWITTILTIVYFIVPYSEILFIILAAAYIQGYLNMKE